MPARVYLFLLLMVVLGFAVNFPAHAQVEPSAQGGPSSDDESQMMTPSLLTGGAYANEAGADERQNYLTASVGGSVAYVDNLLPGSTATPVGATSFSITPAVALNRSTSRQQETFSYNPNFTFYAPTSQLNSINHSANATYAGRLTQHISLVFDDNFVRTSNVFEGSYPFSGGLSGSTQAPVAAAIAPFAEQMSNFANAALTYQFSRDGMIGGGGTFSEFRVPNTNQSAGLFSSDQSGTSAFFARRFHQRHYFGVRYEYILNNAFLQSSQIETQTQTVMGFYSVIFRRSFSVSAAAGSTFVNQSQPQSPAVTSYSPLVVLSMGWQGTRGNVAASFLRTESSGGGLAGAYDSLNAGLTGGWKLTRWWSAILSFNYASVEPLQASSLVVYQGGNSIAANGAIDRVFGEHFRMEFGYQRLHENFSGIQSISEVPDSDRGYVNLSYDFLKKSLGR